MNKPKILVTGATGFTGGHLARRLAQDGHAVRALVRNPQKAKHLHRLGIELIPGDIRDPNAAARAMEGVHTAYHIAATFREEKINKEAMGAINAYSVGNLLEAAVVAGVNRFVHCSTIGVHGDIKNPPADEETPYGPGDLYQETKMEGEKIARAYMAKGEIQVVIFRPGGIYGPGDTRFLKLFQSIKNRRFLMLGSGEVLYQMIYIDDLVDGIIRCGTTERAANNIYILTGNAAITLNQLVTCIAEVVGAPKPRLRFPVMPVYLAGYLCELIFKPLNIEPPLYRRRVDFFRKNRSFTVEKARRELEFVPKVDLRTGLQRTAQWYVEQGLL